MKRITFLFVLWLLGLKAYSYHAAPNDTLVGLILNKSGKAIKNVPVSAHGHPEVTLTDRNGVFVIIGDHLPNTVTIMLQSRKLVQIPVCGMYFLKIQTRETAFSVSQAKDEIMNIGYGQMKKSHSTSGNFSVTGDQLRSTGERDIINALVGKVPGINLVYNVDGKPSILIRGGTSLDSNNDPLYVVDGSIVEDISFINLNDVETVDVLKDGSIYGTRGANGAIIVTTKK